MTYYIYHTQWNAHCMCVSRDRVDNLTIHQLTSRYLNS